MSTYSYTKVATHEVEVWAEHERVPQPHSQEAQKAQMEQVDRVREAPQHQPPLPRQYGVDKAAEPARTAEDLGGKGERPRDTRKHLVGYTASRCYSFVSWRGRYTV